MDSLTQFALGACVGQVVAGRKIGARAALIGGLCATLPDLDVLVPYDGPVAKMTYHRGWSHSLIWLTLIAPVLWWIAARWEVLRNGGIKLGLAIWLALVTHPLLDALTVYGTQLWRPVSETPVSIGSVFIIDPIVTGLLVWGIWASLFAKDNLPAQKRLRGSLLAVSAYLALSVVFQWRLEQVIPGNTPLQATPAAVKALPTPLNIVRWRLMVRDQQQFCDTFVYFWQTPNTADWQCRSAGVPLLTALQGHWPVGRLVWFSKGWVIAEERDGRVVVSDVRMGIAGGYIFSFDVGRALDGELLPEPAIQIASDRFTLANLPRAYNVAE